MAYQRMSLGFLEIKVPIHGIKPCLNKKLGPFPIANDHTLVYQAFLVLAHNKVDILASKMGKGLDNAIWRDDRVVLDHQTLQLSGIGHLVVQALGRIHDVGVLVKIPDKLAVGVFRQRMAHGEDLGP